MLEQWKFAIDGVKIVSPSGEEVEAVQPNVMYWASTYYRNSGAEHAEQVMVDAPDLANRHIPRNHADEGAVEIVFLHSDTPLPDIAAVFVVQEVTGGGTDRMVPVPD